jgi:hypothetical protein
MHGLGARHTQIQTLRQLDDLAMGINRGSNSPNVIETMKKAKKQHLKTIGLAGKDRGILRKCVNIPIVVAIANTVPVQAHSIGFLLREFAESIRLEPMELKKDCALPLSSMVPKPPITA